MMTEEKKLTDAERLQEIGRGAYASIAEMVAALNCDYARLEELRDERDALEADADTAEGDDKDEARKALASWQDVDGEDLADLEAAAGDCEDREEAERRIREDALSVEVRSGWTTLGDTLTADEFCILLTTGGPAVRILGELDEYGEPRRAWLEVQDWSQPWTRYYDAEQPVLLDYARCFYFGE